jgi:hypothetical protein
LRIPWSFAANRFCHASKVQSRELRVRFVTAFPLVAASLIGSASTPECASAQSNPYALDRLFLESNDVTPLYSVQSFSSETQVANFYGKSSPEAYLATEFFNGCNGCGANMLFARYPVLPARAHLYGSNVNDLQQLQGVKGLLSITSQGYNYSGDVNLSNVTSFSQAAADIRRALNKNLAVEAVTAGSSITKRSVSFTGSIQQEVLDVTSIRSGSSIEIGSYISGPGVPARTQITSQLSGTPGGVGRYGFFLREGEVPSETLTESYGVLTVGSVNSGTVVAGQQITNGIRGLRNNILPHTAIEENLSGGDGAGSKWVVNFAQTVASENMTMTGAPLEVSYKRGGSITPHSGHFLVQQWPDVNWNSSSLSYMGGSAGASLGLSESSGAFLSTPGQIVTHPFQWMTNFVASGNPDGSDEWSSFQLAYDNVKAIPPRERQALANWAEKTDGRYQFLWDSENTPPIVDSIPSAAQFATIRTTVPESSTWAMMAIGFAGLGFARYWRARPGITLV